MASTPILAPPYHIQSTQASVLPNPEQFPQHQSVTNLWQKKWRPPCVRGIYPFMDGNVEDFDPIFEELIRVSNDNPAFLYDPDAYTEPFQPVADKLIQRATQAEQQGDYDKAKELYLRACAVLRISRFPINRSPGSNLAWEKNKEFYLKGGKYLDPPVQSVGIPFKHANESAGDKKRPIEVYLRTPKTEKPSDGHPVLLFICGLDAYRTDHTPRTQRHVSEGGFAVMSFEIPGTGDCPAAPGDPESPDRLMSSILDWIDDNAVVYGFNVSQICARGISTGGYYAMRVAHTHANRLFAVVDQGGGSHYMFDSTWISNVNQMEYPFALAEALAYKFGYSSVKAFMDGDNARKKFSLLEGSKKVSEMKNCKLFILNGMEDSIFPIEDSIVIGMYGTEKEMALRANRRHMGEPGGEDMVHAWLKKALAGEA